MREKAEEGEEITKEGKTKPHLACARFPYCFGHNTKKFPSVLLFAQISSMRLTSEAESPEME